MNELDKILGGLIRRTVNGHLKWRSSVEENEFVTSVDAISVVIRSLGGRNWRSPDRYQLVIIDEKGSTVEVFEAGGEFETVAYDQVGKTEQSQQLDELYSLARRTALNTQATIDKLVKALDS
jgi:hypothetical protein